MFTALSAIFANEIQVFNTCCIFVYLAKITAIMINSK